MNGGKENLFQALALQNLDIGVSVGGPLLPDIVGSRYDQLHVVNVRIGFQFFGANVAGQWLQHLHINNFTEAGVQLYGYGFREARSLSQRGSPTPGDAIVDGSGHEVFFEQIPAYAKKLRMLPCPPYCGADGERRKAGGGGPSAIISHVVASSGSGWLIDSNGMAVHANHVRLEGQAGIYRNTGLYRPLSEPGQGPADDWAALRPGDDGRFQSMLYDVSNSYREDFHPADGSAILFAQPSALHLSGCSIGANVSLGTNSTVYDAGTRFAYPDGTRAGGFAQLRGTAGARILRMGGEAEVIGQPEREKPLKPRQEHKLEARVAALEEMVASLQRELVERRGSK